MNANMIVDALPAGYRWATADEADRWYTIEYFDKMVQVGWKDKDDFLPTDLAIKDEA